MAIFSAVMIKSAGEMNWVCIHSFLDNATTGTEGWKWGREGINLLWSTPLFFRIYLSIRPFPSLLLPLNISRFPHQQTFISFATSTSSNTVSTLLKMKTHLTLTWDGLFTVPPISASWVMNCFVVIWVWLFVSGIPPCLPQTSITIGWCSRYWTNLEEREYCLSWRLVNKLWHTCKAKAVRRKQW